MKIVRVLPAAILLATSLLLPAQQQQQQMDQQVKAGSSPEVKTAPKIAKEDRLLAMQTLEIAESTSRGFEPPMRTWGLLQLGQTFSADKPAKATELLRDAFTASLSVADDPETKESLQDEIFRALLPLSQADVEERLAQAEPKVRKRASETIVRRYVEKKQFGPAMDLVTQVAGWDEFPYGAGTALLLVMPAEMQAEKMSILTQAVGSYKAHEHTEPPMGDNFTQMIVRFGPHMPPKVALEAIDELLSQAKKSDQKANGVLSSAAGTFSFNSVYEYQLFAVMPLLRVLDEGRAEALLKENQTIKASLDKFPAGLQSLDPTMTDAPPKEGERGGIMQTWGMGDGPSGDNGMYQMHEMQRKADEIINDSHKNPVQAIAAAQALPVKMGRMFPPRAHALEGIARENFKDNPGPAKQAIDEMRKAIADLDLSQQARFLSIAADLYFKMGDKESAGKVIGEGFKVADKILDKDMNPDDPNKALKAYWPASDAYRRFIDVQAKLSHRGAADILKEIKDPEVRTVESIMLSRALLGLAMKRVRVEQKTKNDNMIMMMSAE